MRPFAAVIVVFLSCDNPPATVPLDHVGRAYAESYCGRIFACCTPDEIRQRFATLMPPITDEPSCIDYFAAGFQNEFGNDVGRAQLLGQARYHGDAMAACLDKLARLSCVDFARVLLLPECRPPPVEGLVDDGDTCDHDFQCRSGYCAGRLAGGAAACAPAPVEAQPCPDGVCAAGLYCDGSMRPAQCRSVAADGQPCSTNFGCLSGSCNGGTCGPPTRCLGAQ